MKQLTILFSLFLFCTCSKDDKTYENRNAIVSETSQFKFYQKNGKLDSAIGQNEKIYFFYKDSLIDSIQRLIKYQKSDFTYFIGNYRSYKFEYENGKLTEEKTGEYIYDVNLDSIYRYWYYPYNTTKYVHLSDSIVEQSWNNGTKKGYLQFKNQNLIKNISYDDVFNYEFDEKFNPFNNFVGLKKLYNFYILNTSLQINSINNLVKYTSRNETTTFKIEYNNTQNPIKINSTRPFSNEEIKY